MRPSPSSGLIIPERYGNETVPEVVSQSGYALLHFFSDAAYNLTGFNISYRSDFYPRIPNFIQSPPLDTHQPCGFKDVHNEAPKFRRVILSDTLVRSLHVRPCGGSPSRRLCLCLRLRHVEAFS